jgi:large subunit ribosomal protein L13
VITGNRDWFLKEYQQKMQRGTHTTGPFQPKTPFRFVKRVLRGMLPYKTLRGRSALKRVKCYNLVPEEFKGKLELLPEAGIENSLTSRYIFVGELCRLMGGKSE